jgi:hypothetical protein
LSGVLPVAVFVNEHLLLGLTMELVRVQLLAELEFMAYLMVVIDFVPLMCL